MIENPHVCSEVRRITSWLQKLPEIFKLCNPHSIWPVYIFFLTNTTVGHLKLHKCSTNLRQILGIVETIVRLVCLDQNDDNLCERRQDSRVAQQCFLEKKHISFYIKWSWYYTNKSAHSYLLPLAFEFENQEFLFRLLSRRRQSLLHYRQ